GERPHAGHRRPARGCGRDQALPPRSGDDQGQPLLGLCLQRRGDPTRGGRAAQPDRRGGRDGVLECLRRHEQPAAPPLLEPERGDMTYGYVEEKESLVKRLHRIEGQVRGIERMVEDERYCIDILTQIAAATTALESVAFKILDEHVNHCVAGALESGDAEVAAEKSRELLEA